MVGSGLLSPETFTLQLCFWLNERLHPAVYQDIPMDFNQYNDSYKDPELALKVRIARVKLTENAEVVFLLSNGLSATVPAHKLVDFAMESAIEFTFPPGGFH